jgi:predicted kinase
MKSLNLARPQMLLIVGNPGAGKSFFARQFSETFDAPVVSLDRIRFELFANPTYSNDENDLVTRVAGYFIEELLKTKRSFVVDGGCNSRAERTRLTQLARKAAYAAPVVWVQTDIATCRTRALKRNPEKNIDDKFNPRLSEQMFENLTRHFTEPTREKHVVISGKHTYGTQAKMVLRKLVADREADAEEAHRAETVQAKQASQRPDTNRRGIIIR